LKRANVGFEFVPQTSKTKSEHQPAWQAGRQLGDRIFRERKVLQKKRKSVTTLGRRNAKTPQCTLTGFAGQGTPV